MYNDLRPLILKAGSETIAEDLRVRVQGSKNMTLLSDFFVFEIYNISSEDLGAISRNKKLYAYAEDGGLLCCGEVDEIYTRIEDTNEITSISVVDGKSFWETKINASFGGGTMASSTFRGIVKNANIGAFTANDFRIIRGQTYDGRLADCVSMIAKSAHGRGYVTNETVYITSKGKAAQTITLSDDEVLENRNAQNGMRLIKTKVKGYPIGAIIIYSGNQYRLISQKITADNTKGTWETYLVMIDERVIPASGMEGG